MIKQRWQQQQQHCPNWVAHDSETTCAHHRRRHDTLNRMQCYAKAFGMRPCRAQSSRRLLAASSHLHLGERLAWWPEVVGSWIWRGEDGVFLSLNPFLRIEKAKPESTDVAGKNRSRLIRIFFLSLIIPWDGGLRRFRVSIGQQRWPLGEVLCPVTWLSLLVACSWYHGKVDRSRAEDLLRNKHTGTYLVRDSSSIPGDFVLSVR